MAALHKRSALVRSANLYHPKKIAFECGVSLATAYRLQRKVDRETGTSFTLEAKPMIYFNLPWPPTINHYYRPSERAGMLRLNKNATAYRAQAISSLMAQKIVGGPLTCRIGVQIVAQPPDERRRDLDNLLKPLLDVLTHAKVIADDSLIDRLLVVRGKSVQGGRIVVTITECAP
jgi:crossover junction endodeoxyribonuclease RusA